MNLKILPKPKMWSTQKIQKYYLNPGLVSVIRSFSCVSLSSLKLLFLSLISGVMCNIYVIAYPVVHPK